MQLVAGLASERAAAVRADLGRDAEAAQQRERAPRDRGAADVDVDGDPRPPPRRCSVPAVRDRAPRARRAGSTDAAGRSPRAPPRTLLGERQQLPPLRARAGAACSRRRAPRRSRCRPPPTTRWHGRKIGEPVPGAERPRRARGVRPTGERGQLAVRHDLTAWHRPQAARQLPLEAESAPRDRARRRRTTRRRRGSRRPDARQRM